MLPLLKFSISFHKSVVLFKKIIIIIALRKQSFIRTLYDLMFALGSVHFTASEEFIDFLNLRM